MTISEIHPHQLKPHPRNAAIDGADAADDAAGAQLQLFPALPPAIEAALRASIERFGVLVPVVQDQQGRILDGHHRARIAATLGVKYRVDVVRVRDEDEARDIQRTLNADRRQLTEAQRREIVAALASETVTIEGETVGTHSPNAIAGALGVSEKTVRDDLDDLRTGTKVNLPDKRLGLDGKVYPARRPVVVATLNTAEALRAQRALLDLGDQVPFDDAPKGATAITPVQLARAQQAQQRAERAENRLTAPPEGTYRCLVIDPPWPVEKILREERPNQDAFDYPTMPLEAIRCLPVGELADSAGCHVYLWTTQKHLRDAFALFEAWGVSYQCLMTWVKPTGMTPYSWMYNTEHVLFGRVGNLPLERMGLKLSFEAPAIRHSQKPGVFYERVLAASPGPRLELFARSPRAGFDAWGNEVR